MVTYPLPLVSYARPVDTEPLSPNNWLAMRLVSNTTDVSDRAISAILCHLGAGGVSCAVKVKNSLKKPYFLGTFYPRLGGEIVSSNGRRYEMGGGKFGCDHLITLRLPLLYLPMALRTENGRVYVEIPSRMAGLALVAAHEVEHAQRFEVGLDYKNERACDARALETATRLGLRVARRRDDLAVYEWSTDGDRLADLAAGGLACP